ncbi:hypothetical protein [Ramlibacter sp. WS9]|uniref:hypothetical protein n=1 Tax=Ramlibacter sp. WS9 TaxID=1882741 RepID=UPI001144A034|nr:hypothetical protein [Ramlibacter sp. WS9]ROZ75348.1 hypothetical protein EEB15_15415 [Ramlibacter sp. WS9]
MRGAWLIAPLLIAPLLVVAHGAGAQPVGLDAAVQSARAHAAKHTGQAAQSFELVKAQAVTWPDGSLGCPQPGMNYTMALVPGYRIQLRAKGSAVMDYHASDTGALVLCPASRSVEPVPDSRT